MNDQPEPAPEALPLAGVRVVELATGLAGSFAGRLLAEAGADVVMVEEPVMDRTHGHTPAAFATWNRSKRSVSLELGSRPGRERLLDLVRRADVVLHDLPASAANSIGLGEDLARSGDVIVCAVPAYPAGHPLEDLAASDAYVQAAEGFMDEQQGNRPGPVFVRLPYPSWSAGYLAATGVVARLLQRSRDGVVLPVATSLLQGALTTAALYWQRWERLPDSLNRHTLPKTWPDAALSIFPCADGLWVQLAGAVGGWIESPPVLESLALGDLVELSEVGVTPTNRSTWADLFRTRTSDEWLDEFSAVDVPCMVLRNLGDCFTDDQTRINNYVVDIDDVQIGSALQAAPPVRTQPACQVLGPAPDLGSTRVSDVMMDWASTSWSPAPGRIAQPGRRPLEGLRALDFGSVVAGPFGAQCLADLGADVIKVEPLAGDRGRTLTQFAGCHRGKRSAAIDLKTPEGRAIVERLVASSDVVLHNMRLRAAGRLGLDLKGLRAVNPDIVFSHVSAYGPDGPMAGFPGYDPTAQAMTGWELANAGDDGDPIWLRNSVFDVHAGLASTFGAVLGLLQRFATGRAGSAETSLLAVGITAASEVAVRADGSITEWPHLDAAQTGTAETTRIYECNDGWVLVDARNAAERHAFQTWVREHQLPAEDNIRSRCVAEVREALTRVGVPCTRVAEDQCDAFFLADAHRGLGLARRLETADFGSIDVVGGFWDPDTATPPAGESVPSLGQHTREILSEIGYPTDDVDRLIETGVVHVGRGAPVQFQGGR